mmetsp:Transcript_89631/g.248941  ORF Transcript_89631/g.248941 Transcript_89631/m.248941 type:complete len:379 (-) Transcript_89631:769-1905(-)
MIAATGQPPWRRCLHSERRLDQGLVRNVQGQSSCQLVGIPLEVVHLCRSIRSHINLCLGEHEVPGGRLPGAHCDVRALGAGARKDRNGVPEGGLKPAQVELVKDQVRDGEVHDHSTVVLHVAAELQTFGAAPRQRAWRLHLEEALGGVLCVVLAVALSSAGVLLEVKLKLCCSPVRTELHAEVRRVLGHRHGVWHVVEDPALRVDAEIFHRALLARLQRLNAEQDLALVLQVLLAREDEGECTGLQDVPGDARLLDSEVNAEAEIVPVCGQGQVGTAVALGRQLRVRSLCASSAADHPAAPRVRWAGEAIVQSTGRGLEHAVLLLATALLVPLLDRIPCRGWRRQAHGLADHLVQMRRDLAAHVQACRSTATGCGVAE